MQECYGLLFEILNYTVGYVKLVFVLQVYVCVCMCVLFYLPSISVKLPHSFFVFAFIMVIADFKDSRYSEREGDRGPGHGGLHRVF